MATIIDSLIITLGIDPQGVRQGMSQADSSISQGVDGIMSKLAPLAGGAAFAAIAANYVESANQIGQVSKMLNMSMEDLQAWQGVAEATGGDAQSLTDAFIDMNEYLVDAVQFGAGPAVDVLKKLGISATDSSGKIKNATDVVLEMVQAGDKISDQEMIAYAKILGLDESNIRMLQMGEKELKNLLKSQKELAVYSEKDAEIAKKAKQSFSALMKVLSAMAAIIMRVILPPLNFFIDILTSIVMFLKKNEKFTIAFFALIAGVITGLLVPALYAMAAAVLANPLTWIFLGVGAIIAGIALVVEDLWHAFTGGKSVLLDLWNYISEFMASIGDKFSNMGKNIKNGFINIFVELKNMFTNFMGMIGDEINAMIDKIPFMSDIKEGASAVSEGVSSAYDGVSNFFGFGGDDGSAMEAQAVAGASNTSTSSIKNDTSVSVGTVVVNTQATDSKEIAGNIGGALGSEMPKNIVMASNTGVKTK